jgi:arylsulfatase A-like enzyme
MAAQSGDNFMSMTRRSFLAGAATLACGAARFSPAASAQAAQRRPNVLFILADDLGWGDLHCYGHPHTLTPNLDQLAKDGILFTRGYACGSVCSPSRTALMTGHFPARHGVHGHFASREMNEQRDMPQYLDPAVPTLPRILRDAGYATGHFGKWHLGGGDMRTNEPSAPEPSAYGLDEYRVYAGNGPGWQQGPEFWPKSSELIVDETIQFIDKHKDKPFFVQTWLKDTHAILAPTEEQRAPYKKYAGALETYYAAVGNMDKQLGRLFNRLKELGLEENTIVVFSSDNGPEDIHVYNASHSGVGSAGPFRGRKRSLYEGGVRVPWLVRWPAAAPRGKVNDTTVISGADFLPTICAITGLEPPNVGGLDGEDLSAAFRGESMVRKKPLFWEFRTGVAGEVFHHSPMLSVRDGDWKLLMNPDRSRIELYNIPEDPTELNNLADRRKRTARRMERQALAWQATLPKGVVAKDAGDRAYPWPRGPQ